MSHALVTVFMRESDTLEELLAPYDEQLVLPETMQPCWRIRYGDREHNETCCNGTMLYLSDSNPIGKWDYWRPLAEQQTHWDSGRYTRVADKPAGTYATFAVVIPGEGWFDRQDITPNYYARGDDDREENERIWNERYRMVADRAIAQGLTPVVCDYHS